MEDRGVCGGRAFASRDVQHASAAGICEASAGRASAQDAHCSGEGTQLDARAAGHCRSPPTLEPANALEAKNLQGDDNALAVL